MAQLALRAGLFGGNPFLGLAVGVVGGIVTSGGTVSGPQAVNLTVGSAGVATALTDGAGQFSRGALSGFLQPLGIGINLINIASTIDSCLSFNTAAASLRLSSIVEAGVQNIADASSGSIALGSVGRVNSLLNSALSSVQSLIGLADQIDANVPIFNQAFGSSYDLVVLNGLARLTGEAVNDYTINASTSTCLLYTSPSPRD